MSTEEWERAIEKDLKGADYEKKLVWKTIDGIKVKPYYRSEDTENLPHKKAAPGEFPYIRGTKREGNKWYIRQDINVGSNPQESNSEALDMLMRGATSIGFIFDEESKIKKGEIKQLLKDIHPEAAEINLITPADPGEALSQFQNECAERGINLSDIRGSVEFDPLGYLSVTGTWPGKIDNPAETAAALVKDSGNMPGLTVLTVNGRHFHNAGASLVQELAFALSVASEYIDYLGEKGISPSDAAAKIRFSFATGPSYFMEIAKFRAARVLWSKILEAWDVPPQIAGRMHIHATNSAWNKTVYDPYVNMLRSTTESMSAVLGGINSFTVQPFDKTFKKQPSGFGKRVARNTQLILKEEAYLDKTADPAGGSYYIDTLTASLMEESWKLFLEVEEKGGFFEALKNDFIQNHIEETARQRDKNIATRRETLVGTNHYPDLSEKASEKIDPGVVWPPQTKASNPLVRPLKLYRGAMAFEELRLKTENSSKATPKVFMLTCGNLTMRKARAGFASSFFGCAGFEIIDNLGFKSGVEGAQAALESNSDIVVVCSSDEEYPALVPQVIEKIGKKAIVVVAGYPKESVEQLEKAGVRHFIHLRSNMPEKLKEFQKELGIR